MFYKGLRLPLHKVTQSLVILENFIFDIVKHIYYIKEIDYEV